MAGKYITPGRLPNPLRVFTPHRIKKCARGSNVSSCADEADSPLYQNRAYR